MAKTADQIAAELAEAIESIDATLDTSQGPIPDLFIRPQSGLLAEASEAAEQLRLLFTISFPTAATEEEISQALLNYGSKPGEGTKSRHTQYFMRFTRPTVDVEIPVGTLVSNPDGSLVYKVISAGLLPAASANVFYNASRGAYELGLLVEAVGIGVEYELPPYRITTIQTPVVGIDATENRMRSTGGSAAESITSQTNRLKTALLGTNLGSPNGVRRRILDAYNGTVTDVAVIEPYQPEFSRITDKPSLDIYVIGSETETYTERFVAVNGQTAFALTKKPAVNISTVLINNVSSVIDFQLVRDTNLETAYSLNAEDQIIFSTGLLAGDIVEVTYDYNKLLTDINTSILDSGNGYLFNTDILLRSPFGVNPVVTISLKLLPSYDSAVVGADIRAYLQSIFDFKEFKSILLVENVRQGIIENVSGIQTIRFKEFRRSSGATATVETIYFAANEASVYLDSDIKIEFSS